MGLTACCCYSCCCSALAIMCMFDNENRGGGVPAREIVPTGYILPTDLGNDLIGLMMIFVINSVVT